MSVDIVTQVKQELLAAGQNCDHQCGAFKITSTVAWRLRAYGWGLIHSTGNGCTTNNDHYRVDTLMLKDGSVIDCLGLAETNNGLVYPAVPLDSYNIPQWNPTGPQPPENWREPYDPGLLTTPEPGPEPLPPAGEEEILNAIADSAERVMDHTTAETERVLHRLNELRDEVIEFAEQAGKVILAIALRRRDGTAPPPEA